MLEVKVPKFHINYYKSQISFMKQVFHFIKIHINTKILLLKNEKNNLVTYSSAY